MFTNNFDSYAFLIAKAIPYKPLYGVSLVPSEMTEQSIFRSSILDHWTIQLKTITLVFS